MVVDTSPYHLRPGQLPARLFLVPLALITHQAATTKFWEIAILVPEEKVDRQPTYCKLTLHKHLFLMNELE
jgi:hypothetical protein